MWQAIQWDLDHESHVQKTIIADANNTFADAECLPSMQAHRRLSGKDKEVAYMQYSISFMIRIRIPGSKE